MGHFVRGTFCPLGRFFSYDVLTAGRFVLGRIVCASFTQFLSNSLKYILQQSTLFQPNILQFFFKQSTLFQPNIRQFFFKQSTLFQPNILQYFLPNYTVIQ